MKGYKIGRSRYKYYSNNAGPYYLTCTTVQWIALFGLPDISQIILNSLRFLIENGRIELHGFIMMEHHLHIIASGESLSKEIGIFKSYTARQIIEYLNEHNFNTILKQFKFFKKQHKHTQDYQVWQEGSHPQLITDSRMLNQKLEYMHYNPDRAQFVDDPVHWRYSSYRHYIGMECLLPIHILV